MHTVGQTPLHARLPLPPPLASKVDRGHSVVAYLMRGTEGARVTETYVEYSKSQTFAAHSKTPTLSLTLQTFPGRRLTHTPTQQPPTLSSLLLSLQFFDSAEFCQVSTVNRATKLPNPSRPLTIMQAQHLRVYYDEGGACNASITYAATHISRRTVPTAETSSTQIAFPAAP